MTGPGGTADAATATAGWPGGREIGRRAAAALRLSWRASRWLTAAEFASAAVHGGAAVLVAWSTKLLIDRLAHGRFEAAGWLAAAVAVTAVAVTVLGQLDQYVTPVLRRAIATEVQRTLFGKVNSFVGLAPLENPRLYDRLRLAQQAGEAAPQQTTGGLAGAAGGLVQLAGFVTALYLLWPPMVVATLLAAIPVVVADLRLAGGRAGMYMATSPGYRRRLFYQMLLTDRAAAMEGRLFGTTRFLYGRMVAAMRDTTRTENAFDARVFRLRAGSALLGGAVTGGGLVLAVHRAAAGHLTPGDVVLFVAAVAGVQAALLGVASRVTAAYEALLVFGNYREVMATPRDLPVGDGRPGPLRDGIEFRDVWFRYDGGPWVLRGVSFTVPFGSAVGLVGENGAGKSTVVKLLCRFYDPQRGQILWDGVDLRDLRPETLRARFGAVFQDFFRYDLTAAENIGLGDPDAMHDRPRVAEAALLAGADAFLRDLPAGYDTMLSRVFFANERDGEGAGTILSGGQWQRVALARSVMRTDADLLILDEPSSGLDARAEHEVHAALRAYRRGRTSLLISHRLGTLRDADRIVVLAGGRVVECGDHDGLIRRGGTYAGLFALQADGYRDRSSAEVDA
ncbi:multidrug ABC transporter permease [Sphaerisporangium krabiense]|uniref:ATP-binding cassette subfamily B protein n=1 Tax=Sphaerisporangium krabiense TaxID=763782 RepID=A0A7W9DN33_9ACTN|nr:ABC transporter ATP-binding protein [Sphaerisporangium krabiense]MBB5624594.1 ATP-binding cassette subfamily B protein [Sphaerisporangium krabiense]GII61453.1 multidrug ABC transporter permease [Sphaerisporangium krabiense]